MRVAKRLREGVRGRRHRLQRVAALLHDQRRQRQLAVQLADAGVGVRGHGQLGQRVVAVGVPAGRQDQRLRAVRPHRLGELGIGGDEGGIVGAEGQRQVEVGALAGARAGLVRIAGEVGIVGGRVGVHRAVQHVGAVIEDGLRAVAVVRVEIDDGDALKLAPQHLRRDCRVVEVAEARAAVGVGVVPGRAAQRERGARASQHLLGPGDCRLRRGVGGAPRPLHGGARHVAHVPAGAADDAGDARRPAVAIGLGGAAVGMHVGQHLGPVVRQLHEARVGLFQEGEVVAGMHLRGSARARSRRAPRARARRAPARRSAWWRDWGSRTDRRSARAPCTAWADARVAPRRRTASWVGSGSVTARKPRRCIRPQARQTRPQCSLNRPGSLHSCYGRQVEARAAQESSRMKIPGPDHPITIAPNPKRVRILFNGRVVADTMRALTLREATLAPVQYIPRADADMSAFVRTARATHCPYKGDAAYYSLQVDGRASDERRVDLRDAVRGGGRDQGPPRLLSEPRRRHRGEHRLGVRGARHAATGRASRARPSQVA